MHFKWNYEAPTPEQQKTAKELGDKLNVSPILGQLLIQRGITTESAAKRFFRPQLADLINPFLMKDMDVAVDRLNDAMGRKERILVYGDYDVDGCTAVALVYKFLQQFYSNIEYYIPDRYDEGYGVSKKGIDYAHETGVKLIIILDCGIKAVKEIEYAKTLGIDFIICDHHVPDEVMPPAVAILNPKQPDDPFPFKHLCGCGVGFKFMQAFAKDNGIPFSRLIPLLDFCAVSIAADIVPVVDENRILAFHGLKLLNSNPSIGLKSIIDICGLNGREISMSDIVFKIGPRINASGRMENGKLSVDLLVERDFATALRMAKHINEYNEQRKDIDKQMTEEANGIVSRLESQKHNSSIVLYDEGWKKGVIGIVDAVSRHYSYAISFLNTEVNISSRLGGTGAVGPLAWDGKNTDGAILKEIPLQYRYSPGDTVYTSGYSVIFPPDIPLGTAGDASIINGATNEITVNLFQDYTALKFVTIVRNTRAAEIEALEQTREDKDNKRKR